MTFPVITFRTVEKIGRILKVLNSDASHNGYPVVEDYYPDNPDKVGNVFINTSVLYPGILV